MIAKFPVFQAVFAAVVIASAFVSPDIAGQEKGWGHLTGQIIVEGKVPEATALVVDKDVATCLRNQAAILDPSLVVGEDGGLKDAFVFLYFGRKGNGRKPDVHDSYKEMEDAKIVLDNLKCRFEPYALFVRTSQTLTMKNSDDVGHNCHVTLLRNEVNANLPIGDAVDVQLTEVEKVPGPVKCDIHPWMTGLILVRDEPYVAITDKDGNFTIKNLPEGEWTFQFWHKRSGYLKTLTRDGTKFLGKRGEVKLEIKSGETLDLGKLLISVEKLKEKN